VFIYINFLNLFFKRSFYMNVKFMIAVLTYVSVALVHECHAGGGSSKAVAIQDERGTADTVRVPPIQPKEEKRKTPPPVAQQPKDPLQQDPNANLSSHPSPQGLVQLLPSQEDLEKVSTKPSAPVPSAPAAQQNEERSIVLYKTLKFHGHEVPYPLSAEIEYSATDTVLKQTICSIILLNVGQVETHEIAQKVVKSSINPESPEDLEDYLATIYEDLGETGKLTNRQESAEEAIQTLKQLVLRLKLAEIFSHTNFQRSDVTLASRVMIRMNDGAGEVVILDVHGLPEHLWIKSTDQ
jgi:hypothetical protein